MNQFCTHRCSSWRTFFRQVMQLLNVVRIHLQSRHYNCEFLWARRMLFSGMWSHVALVRTHVPPKPRFLTTVTRRHIAQHGILRSHRSENLKFCGHVQSDEYIPNWQLQMPLNMPTCSTFPRAVVRNLHLFLSWTVTVPWNVNVNVCRTSLQNVLEYFLNITRVHLLLGRVTIKIRICTSITSHGYNWHKSNRASLCLYLYILGPNQLISPEEGDRIQSPNCKILGFHDGDYEEWRPLRCYAAWLL
jgi:hypothetical protein